MGQQGATRLVVLTYLLPGLGHDCALLQTHQLHSELEALRSLRAVESDAAAAQEDLLSVSEPHVRPILAHQVHVQLATRKYKVRLLN